jgi:hypothetical protein
MPQSGPQDEQSIPSDQSSRIEEHTKGQALAPRMREKQMTTTEVTERLPTKAPLLFWILAFLGGLTLVAGLFLEPRRTWIDLFLISNYMIGLGLAGLLLVAFHYITGARWSLPVRRVSEAMTAVLPFAAIGMAAVLIARPSLYSWTLPATLAGVGSPLQHFWLNRPFFLLRAAVYLGIWLTFAAAVVRNSRQQDTETDPAPTNRNIRLSALFLVAFGVTCWLASYDWIMSLDPKWASTVFGVYYFASLFLSGLAADVLLVIWLRRNSPLQAVIAVDHLHDLGTLLFGFSSFWMYAWFCQYMLIWYVNIPDETAYLRQRWQGTWPAVLFADLALNWGVPFLVLLFRSAKRNPWILGTVAVVVLAGRWIDLFVMVVPSQASVAPVPGLIEAGLILGTAGLFVLAVFRALNKASLVPLREPLCLE